MMGLVVHFLIHAMNPDPDYKRKPIKKEQIGFHDILLEKIEKFGSGPVFSLCIEMLRMFRPDEHIDNYDEMKLYVFLNKIIPKSKKSKRKRKGSESI